ncbi:signal peptidase I [Nesterenkonia ebinurensis]|uniref:signal peptidase I n=1 Tax=Nesterenkonia ebinurensis TaxID=2608252 RepID=UPI00123D5AE1|nr:signal peptidase I [Nesterenkonia ebinurensis]
MIRRAITETLLWLAAAAGLVCIVLVILAYTLGISLIMFRTGSMEPTIPTGSVAVVQDVEAAEVQIGDILTVDREGELPVTHRVTAIEDGSDAEERIIRMQGDANTTEDPHPYTITEARRVLFSVPGLAQPLNQMNNPYVLGSLTLSATALVIWAFWPRKSEQRHPAAARRHPRHAGRGTAAVMATVIGGAALVTAVPPAPALAAEQEYEYGGQVVIEHLEGNHINLTSKYLPDAQLNLAPATGVIWDIGIMADPPEHGMIQTSLIGEGEFPLMLTAASCTQEWQEAPRRVGSAENIVLQDCPGEVTLITELTAVPMDRTPIRLGSHSTDEDIWYRLVVAAEPGLSREHMGKESTLLFYVQGSDEPLDGVGAPRYPDEVSNGATPSPTDPQPSAGPQEPGLGEETISAEDPAPSEIPATDETPIRAETPSRNKVNELAVTGFPALAPVIAALIMVAIGSYLTRRAAKTGSETREQS